MVGVIQNKGSPGSMTSHRAECFYAIKEGVDSAAKTAAKKPEEGSEEGAKPKENPKTESKDVKEIKASIDEVTKTK